MNDENTAAVDAAKKKKNTTTRNEALAYLGPNRAYGLPIMMHQVFAGGALPDTWSILVSEKAHFAACFVPVSGLAAAMAAKKNAVSDLARSIARVCRETLEQRLKAAEGK